MNKYLEKLAQDETPKSKGFLGKAVKGAGAGFAISAAGLGGALAGEKFARKFLSRRAGVMAAKAMHKQLRVPKLVSRAKKLDGIAEKRLNKYLQFGDDFGPDVRAKNPSINSEYLKLQGKSRRTGDRSADARGQQWYAKAKVSRAKYHAMVKSYNQAAMVGGALGGATAGIGLAAANRKKK